MTDSEKLNLIISEIQGLKTDMEGMKSEMQDMKQRATNAFYPWECS